MPDNRIHNGGRREGAGKPPKPIGELSVNFPTMKAAASGLKLDIAIVRDAKERGCPAFFGNGAVRRDVLIQWLKDNPHTPLKSREEISRELTGTSLEDFAEDYTIPDEAGGVGQTLKSLQAYERRLKKRLDLLEQENSLHALVKQEMVEKAQAGWIKVVNALLKYDLAVDTAKRESGELIPLADAQRGIQGLLAWHTIAMSDTLRNVIPELEGKTKFDMAIIIDPAMRSAIYRSFKMGVKFGKIPEWMEKTASDFIASEPPLSLTAPPPISTNLEDY